jgi:probable phosphoglycerate mutase
VALFSHGHFSRFIIASWLQLPASRGRSFAIRAGSVTVLGFEHHNPVIWAAGDIPGTPGVGR